MRRTLIRTRKLVSSVRFFHGRAGNTRQGVRIWRRPPTQFIKEAFFSGSQGKNQNSASRGTIISWWTSPPKRSWRPPAAPAPGFPEPVPLPTEKEVVTILRAVHKYKDSREQFETRTHKRLIDILRPSNKTVEALMGLELPAGVEIEIKL